ncbi:MAG: ABC transporter permease [Chloroflexi bacterium]|nr:ABC transporter permease [Chloroflexota bacterium]
MDSNSLLKLRQTYNRTRRWLGLVSLAAGLLAWWLAARYGGLPAFILPSPSDVWTRFLRALVSGELARHTGATLLEVLLGLFFGTTFAIIIGYILAKSRALEQILSPYLVASQAVPLVAIAPLLVLWFGPGIFSKILIVGLIVFFPVLVNTVFGIRAVPPAYYDLMRSLRASRRQILQHLEIPAALPIFFGGLRIGATLSVIGAVVGELVGANTGLGVLINISRGTFDTPMVFVAVFTLIVLALCLYGIVAWMERKFLIWQEHVRQ